jgi:hypothetical protein
VCAYAIVAAIVRWIADSSSTKRGQLFIRTHNATLSVAGDARQQ